MTTTMFFLALLLFSKHLIADFYLQFPKHYMYKGIYGAWGGIEHAGIHAVFTFFIFAFFGYDLWSVLLATVLDGVIHYHVDWYKMKIDKEKQLSILTENGRLIKSEWYYRWLGNDQYAHAVTYLILLWLIG